MKTASGFTLLEMLIVIAIIGILAAVLVPNMLRVRDKANLAAAQSTGRNAISGMAQVEIDGGQAAHCDFIGHVLTITANGNTERINAPKPIDDITCNSTPDQWEANVKYYSGGTLLTYVASARKN